MLDGFLKIVRKSVLGKRNSRCDGFRMRVNRGVRGIDICFVRIVRIEGGGVGCWRVF